MQNIQNEINLVKEKILSFCCESQNLQDVLKEFLSRKSKLIRSIVAILFLKSANETITDEQYSILAATELIHNASLIHDDAIDENVIRRGKDSINSKFGDKFSIIAGDYVTTLATQELLQAHKLH